jgi:hypothetical protein
MYEPTFLRLNAEVKAELRKQARSERRSMASLIEEFLRHGLAARTARTARLVPDEPRSGVDPAAVEALIAAARRTQ